MNTRQRDRRPVFSTEKTDSERGKGVGGLDHARMMKEHADSEINEVNPDGPYRVGWIRLQKPTD